MEPKNTAFDDFVNDLPNDDASFDINGELGAPQEGNQEPIVTPAASEPEVPFNQNPKIQRFIDRQVKKALEAYKPAQQTVVPTSSDEIPSEWLAIYGDNEAARNAWPLQKKMYDKVAADAEARAMERYQSEQQKEAAEVESFKEFIETSLEEVEEQFGTDFTSNTPAAKKAKAEFLDLVQRLSPKDSEGNVTSYADFKTAYELYDAKKSAATTTTVPRQKALAARSASRPIETPAPQEGYEAGMGFDGIRAKLGL